MYNISVYLERLTIYNYRNYDIADIRPSERLNVFVGDNAQGKTNLLESIYFSSIGRSPRTPRDNELIKWGADSATVKTRVSKKSGYDDVMIRLDNAKRITINGMPISRLGELMGVLTTVLFTPDELRIVKDGPGERRRFIDIALCQMSKVYFDCLSRYNRVLSQRNKLLKNNPTDDAIELWDAQLSSVGARVIKTRRGFVEKLAAFAGEMHRDISGTEQMTLKYESIEGQSTDEIESNFLAALKKSRERDKMLFATSVGAQRDDVAIMADDCDLRAYGSQGQQRTAALSLKLAVMELFREQTGEYPVLLLDDVLSELDETRQSKLLSHIKSYQTIVTATDFSADVRRALGAVKEYHVSGGSVTSSRG